MGYYTDYELCVVNLKKKTKKRLTSKTPPKVYEKALEISNEFWGMAENGFVNSKWYEHESHMIELSLAFPELLFKLSGIGEDDEPTDIWHKYFLNGKMQVCHAEITFSPFDLDKLEESK